MLLEARDRIGGRVWTDRSFVSFPIENGAEFIHGDRAVTWQLVQMLGAPTIALGQFSSYAYEHEDKLYRYEDLRHWPDMARVLQLEASELGQVDPQAPDQSLHAWLSQLGLTPQARRRAEQFLAHPYLAEPQEIGVADLAHEVRVQHAGSGNFRLPDGYDQVLTALAHNLDIRLNTAVHRVSWQGGSVEVAATAHPDYQSWPPPPPNTGGRGGPGARSQPELLFTADQVVITVPLSLLQQQVITFEPPLPPAKLQAIQALRMGPVLKLQLEFSELFWDPEVSLYSGLGSVPVWWSPGYHQNQVPPVLIAFVGGQRALTLNAVPEAAAVARGLDELCRLFASETPRRSFVKGRRISWIDDPWSRGGYTHVPTGAYGARQALAAPVQNLLFFAGEATVTDSNPATVHGAIETGRRAAQEILG